MYNYNGSNFNNDYIWYFFEVYSDRELRGQNSIHKYDEYQKIYITLNAR